MEDSNRQQTAVRYFNGRQYHVLTTRTSYSAISWCVFTNHTTLFSFRMRWLQLPVPRQSAGTRLLRELRNARGIDALSRPGYALVMKRPDTAERNPS
jgi:hypothetical protein